MAINKIRLFDKKDMLSDNKQVMYSCVEYFVVCNHSYPRYCPSP